MGNFITPQQLAQCFFIVGFLGWFAQEAVSEERVWTSTNGSEIKARLIKVQHPYVVLSVKGKLLTVKFQQLSEGDREYLKTVTEKAKKEKQMKIDPAKFNVTASSEILNAARNAGNSARSVDPGSFIIVDSDGRSSIVRDDPNVGEEFQGLPAAYRGSGLYDQVAPGFTVEALNGGLTGITSRAMIFYLSRGARLNNCSHPNDKKDTRVRATMELYEGEMWFEINKDYLEQDSERFVLRVPGGFVEATSGNHYVKVGNGSILIKALSGSLKCFFDSSISLSEGEQVLVNDNKVEPVGAVKANRLGEDPPKSLELIELGVSNNPSSDGLTLRYPRVYHSFATSGGGHYLYSHLHEGWEQGVFGNYGSAMRLTFSSEQNLKVLQKMYETVKDRAREVNPDFPELLKQTRFESYSFKVDVDFGDLEGLKPLGYWLNLSIDYPAKENPLVISRPWTTEKFQTVNPAEKFDLFLLNTNPSKKKNTLWFRVHHEELMDFEEITIKLKARAVVHKSRKWEDYKYDSEYDMDEAPVFPE